MIALNTAFVTDGALIRIGKGASLAKPVLLVFVRAGKAPHLVTTRNSLKIGDGARATVIEAHVSLPGAGAGQANTLSEIAVGDGAASDPCEMHAGRHRHEPCRQLRWRRSARQRAIGPST